MINKKNTSDLIIEEIFRMISVEQLVAGDKLPSEIELAKKFGVSRLSVREALQRLSAIDYIDIRQGEGTFIKQIDVVDLLEARYFIEIGIVRLACKKITEHQLNRLQALLVEMEQYLQVNDYLAFSEKDLQFHALLAEAAGNKILAKSFNNIGFLILLQQEMVLRYDSLKDTHDAHRRLFGAIKEGDSAKAEAVIEEHVRCANSVLSNRV